MNRALPSSQTRQGSRGERWARQIGQITLFCLGAISVAGQPAPSRPVQIKVNPGTVVGHIAPDFLGFGYETSAVAQTNYFSATNTTLIQLYRNLGSNGLIRIGGNISDHTRFAPDGQPLPRTEREVTVINRQSLADLAGFALATGWRVMWGLNLGTGSPAEAAEEAVAVAAALGDRLQSFEIGNEVDLHGGYRHPYQTYSEYFADYQAFKTAIRAALPAAVFSGPDVAGNLAWFQTFAATESRDTQLLTYHYYRTGANRPDASIATLLGGDPAWERKLDQLQKTSQTNGVPYRINEVNSFYGGGKSGVSDTFASALWGLDYLFVLASHGCAGINVETDVNQLGWISHYSPIVHGPDGHCHARPEYYALLAFARAGHGNLLPVEITKSEVNVTAYATRDGDGPLWITVLNKDLNREAELNIELPTGYRTTEAFPLRAPAVTSREAPDFDGGTISS